MIRVASLVIAGFVLAATTTLSVPVKAQYPNWPQSNYNFQQQILRQMQTDQYNQAVQQQWQFHLQKMQMEEAQEKQERFQQELLRKLR